MSILPREPDKVWFFSYLERGLTESPAYTIDSPNVRVKLDQNESPFDWPSDLKRSIADRLAETPWQRYPDAYASELAGLVGRYAGVDTSNIMLSPGSNHLIALMLSTLSKRRQGKLVIARPSFALYEQHSRFEGLPYEIWPLNAKMQYDLALLPPLSPGSLLVFASPNNPVGNTLERRDLAEILSRHPDSLVIADEAYTEFAREPLTPLLSDYGNLIIVRTFSKTLAAAGLRLGYSIASRTITAELKKMMLPYLINRFTLIAATVALNHAGLMQRLREHVIWVIEAREKLFAALAPLSSAASGFELIPSQANFLLLRWPDPHECTRVYRALISDGILVRNVSGAPGLAGCLRLSIGTASDNAALLASLQRAV